MRKEFAKGHLAIMEILANEPNGCIYLPRLEAKLRKPVRDFTEILIALEDAGLIAHDPPIDLPSLSFTILFEYQITPKGREAFNEAKNNGSD